MKREELEKLGLEKEAIDSVMKLHGKSVESKNAAVTAAEDANKTLQGQLDEANKAISGFEAMKPDEIKSQVEEWKNKAAEYKTQAEKAATDAENAIADVEYNHALNGVLEKDFNVINPSDVNGKIDRESIVFKDGKFTGLEEQVKQVQETHKHYFKTPESEEKPTFTTKSKSHNVTSGDAFEAAARRGAQLPAAE